MDIALPGEKHADNSATTTTHVDNTNIVSTRDSEPTSNDSKVRMARWQERQQRENSHVEQE